MNTSQNLQQDGRDGTEDSSVGQSMQAVDGNNHVQQLRDLLTPQDRDLTTQFTVNIIDQLDFVYFEEGDRRSHRTHLPIGFKGICCRHCKAGPGKSGRFFPSSLKTLSDTKKTTYTLHRHFIKCQETPYSLKEILQKLQDNHLNERKTVKSHGSQRAFFRRVWGFLCPEAEGDSIASCAIDKTKKAKDGKNEADQGAALSGSSSQAQEESGKDELESQANAIAIARDDADSQMIEESESDKLKIKQGHDGCPIVSAQM